jgi:hypothetical protein
MLYHRYEAVMRNRFTLFALPMAAAIAVIPLLAESKQKERQDDGVQQAIAYQRAKDRADAAQARKERQHPEQFTYAAPKQNPPDGVATEQKREALQKSEKTSDRTQQPRQ